MTNKLNKEFDLRLRAFINAPDNYLESIGLVNCFHAFPVLASKEAYAVEIEGKHVTPVFTDEEDCLAFQESQASAKNQEWVLRSALDVLREVIELGLAGLVFNLKQRGDAGNSTFFASHDMIQFVNSFTLTLNHIMGEKNKAADQLEKYYLIPAFIHPTEDGSEDRLFPTMSNPDGESYVPVFSDLMSFAKWYNQDDFGGNFRQAQGRVMTWKIADLIHPEMGENDIDDTKGIVIDPFNEDMVMLTWEMIKQ